MKLSRVEINHKYRVIQDTIRHQIESGTLRHGEKLPSEQNMARDFGVAHMTVRNALNQLASEGLLQRVHGKGTFVQKLSDEPEVLTLSLVVPSLQQLWNVAGLYYFPAIVQGFCAEATRLGYEPNVMGRSKEAFRSAPEEVERLAGAACLLISGDDMESIEGLRDLGVPVVGVNSYKGRRSISYVAADQVSGMADAVEMLVAKGHRRLAFLPGPTNNLGAEERWRGFRRGMAEAGLAVPTLGAGPRDYTDVTGYARTKALMASANAPTALLAAGDLLAAGALKALRELGLDVPRDVSVVGFGDFHLASLLQPTLTTVRLPLAELGEEAASLLHRQIEGNSRQKTPLLPTHLITRESVGPPPGA